MMSPCADDDFVPVAFGEGSARRTAGTAPTRAALVSFFDISTSARRRLRTQPHRVSGPISHRRVSNARNFINAVDVEAPLMR